MVMVDLLSYQARRNIMWKNLIYGGKEYKDFKINKNGDIIKVSTNNSHSNYVHNGYVVSSLHLGGKDNIKNIRIHKALAETFIPNPNNLKCVHHKDGNKLNNNFENLEWVSYKQHRKYHKVVYDPTNKINAKKLTDEQVKYVRDLIKTEKVAYIAKMFNVSRKTIYNIIQNKLYVGV